MRVSITFSTLSDAARPNRASQAFGIRSEFTMVPVAVPSSITATRASDRVRVRVSEPSLCASSSTGTATVFEVSSGCEGQRTGGRRVVLARRGGAI